MSQCKHNATEFIQNTFSPHIAVLCSADAQLLCQKNNLTFVQLIQPFCRLSSEVHIRDANNVSHSIHNLRISACDMAAQAPQQNIIKKKLNDAVSSTNYQLPEPSANNMMSFGAYDLHLSASTPWFESWRETFLEVLPPSDHEYLNHCLACIFVVASNNSDPLSTFTALANQQVVQQQQFPNKLPRWFTQGILHYYVLLHDVLDGEHARAEAVYQSMKATFGVQICHLLQINSRSLHTMESIKSGIPVQPDPWSQFLTRQSSMMDSYEADLTPSNEDPTECPQTMEGSHENLSQKMSDSLYDNNIMEESGSSGITLSSCDQLSHPLASPTTPPSRDTPSPDSDPTAAAGGYHQADGRHSSSSHHHRSSQGEQKGHGMCLTPTDLDRLRIFMHEFVVRALIPWAERQMKMLSEQITSRKGIKVSLFNATRKWFGNKPAGPVPTSQNTTVVYTKDAPELQLRRLGDLAFLFQMYDFAYSTYHTAKKDFNNDQAWLHFAGTLEMASLSLFLLGPASQKPYSHHHMDTAISTYLTSCRNPQYATRASLTSTEALKKMNMYQEAAMQFLRMTSEDSDLTSALFLEQAAHCFLALKVPMVRKYSFHMILAGHRFNKAGQRKHSLRSYNQALQVYKGKHWSIAEDHIHFTIGRQSFNLKQLENATASFKHLLTDESKQPTSQQAAFLREYLFVYRQLLNQEERDNSSYGHLPELPLPLVDSNATKVLLSVPKDQQGCQGKKIPASGIWFDTGIETIGRWTSLEEKVVQGSKPNPQLFMDCTDNKANPVAFVGEPIHIQLSVANPLQVMLVLSDVSLLWTFLPSIQGPDPPQVISNEVTTGVKNSLADEIVQTSVIKEVVVQGNQTENIHLTLTPRQPGQLRVAGLAYNLGTSSLAQNAQMQQAAGVGTGGSHSGKPSYTSSVYVRGKQRLEPQGPRLNGTKEERTHKLYGPDRRLDVVVHEEMPCLQVAFCDFPDNVLCGEVHCIEIEFTNSGCSALHNLKVTSSHPRFFTFGSSANLPKYPYVYQMRSSDCSSLSSTLTSTASEKDSYSSLPDILNIPLPKGELQPGDVITVPFWLRGDDIGGVHEMDFLFYYEPVKHSSNIRHRVVRHRAVLNTVESLSVRACVSRPGTCINSKRDHGLNSCIFSCELENLSQVQVQRPHVQELQVTQVSCVSPCWTLVSLGARHQSGVRLGSRETLQLVMKGLKQDQEKDSDKLIFSEVAFDRDQVNTSCSPCSDFFVRSWLHHKQQLGQTTASGNSHYHFNNRTSSSTAAAYHPSSSSSKHSFSSSATDGNSKGGGATFFTSESLESAVVLNLTLVFLWKAYVVQESGQMNIVVGQHHVHVDRLNACAMSYPLPPAVITSSAASWQRQQQQKLPALKFSSGRQGATTTAEESGHSLTPGPEVTTRLVTYSFGHCHQLEFAFTKGLCVIPVTLTVQNHTRQEVRVVVDTKKSPEILNPTTTAATATANMVTISTTSNAAQVGAASSSGGSTDGGTVSAASASAASGGLSGQPPSASTHNVRWVGMTQASLTLARGQNSQLSLKAALTRPGTYNLNCLSVFVTYTADQSQMILQKHTTPSIVTVVDISSSSS